MKHTLHISAGAGPIEVREFIALLAERLAEIAETTGLNIVSMTFYGDQKTPRSVIIDLDGHATSALQPYLGTHVLIAPSPRRERNSRKRWFAGVRLLPSEEVPTPKELCANDVVVKTTRSGGPGGQHVNTTNSAVRILHPATGISVRVSSQRSQHQNKNKAMQRLAELLAERSHQAHRNTKKSQRLLHYQFERGSAVQQWRVDARGKLQIT